MHTHQITDKKHSAFLEQGRIDPITGETLKAGDEVVFCASCKSAFLLDSWQYLEGKHCDQEETLAVFPEIKSLSLKYEKVNVEEFHLEKSLFSNYTQEPEWRRNDSPLEWKEALHIMLFVFSVCVF